MHHDAHRAARLCRTRDGHAICKLGLADDIVARKGGGKGGGVWRCGVAWRRRCRYFGIGRGVGSDRSDRPDLTRIVVNLADYFPRGLAVGANAGDVLAIIRHDAVGRLAVFRCRRHEHNGIGVGVDDSHGRGHIVGIAGNRHGFGGNYHHWRNRAVGLAAHIGGLGDRSGVFRGHRERRRGGGVVVGGHNLAGHCHTGRIIFHALDNRNSLHQRDVGGVGFRCAVQRIVGYGRHPRFRNGRHHIGGCLARPFFRLCCFQFKQFGGGIGIGVKGIGRVDQVALGVGFVPAKNFVVLGRGEANVRYSSLNLIHRPVFSPILRDAVDLIGFGNQVFRFVEVGVRVELFRAPIYQIVGFRRHARIGNRRLQRLQCVVIAVGILFPDRMQLRELAFQIVAFIKKSRHLWTPVW